MLRRIVAVSMLISFVAMATSGVMMFVVGNPSFIIQMDPVHKTFGILMIVSAIAHVSLNFRVIKSHLHFRSALVAFSALTAILVLLYGVALNNSVPSDLARVMDEAAAKAESGESGK